jgi:hypothetical protein
MTIKSISSVLKPENVFKFEAKWEELQKKRGKDMVKPQMVYVSSIVHWYLTEALAWNI